MTKRITQRLQSCRRSKIEAGLLTTSRLLILEYLFWAEEVQRKR